jgi:hypothetical protein
MQHAHTEANEAAETAMNEASPVAASEDRLGAPSAREATDEPAPFEAEEATGAAKKKKKKKTKLGLRVEHQTAGRVRLKVGAGKNNPELLEAIGKTFGAIPGIERITVNPTTGSLVLHYDHKRHNEFHRHFSGQIARHGYDRPPVTELDDLANKIEREAEFLAEHSHSAKMIVNICKRLDREIKTRSNNYLDLKLGLAGGVIGMTLLELGATAATPVWLTLGVFTLNHFVELQQHIDLEKQVHKVDKSAPVIVKGEKTPPSA